MVHKVIHKAATRGHADHGWLNTHHTFSFANYYDPERVHFGMLRVLNDDVVAPGMGFGTHPHDNMEIISIPLDGDLEHRDSMGNVSVIRKGDVQVMSAGTGITHSEYNKNRDKPVKFLQIWVIPRDRNLPPRYSQITMDPAGRKNKFQQIVSPYHDDEGAWIHQDAWFYLADLDKGVSLDYTIREHGHGIYVFVLRGRVTIEGEKLSERDGMGFWNTDKLTVKAHADAEVLLIEVPMK